MPVASRCKELPRWQRWWRACLRRRRHRRCGFWPGVGKIPWRRTWQPIALFLPAESADRGAWWATLHRVARSQDTTEATAHTQETCEKEKTIQDQSLTLQGTSRAAFEATTQSEFPSRPSRLLGPGGLPLASTIITGSWPRLHFRSSRGAPREGTRHSGDGFEVGFLPTPCRIWGTSGVLEALGFLPTSWRIWGTSGVLEALGFLSDAHIRLLPRTFPKVHGVSKLVRDSCQVPCKSGVSTNLLQS